MKLFSVISRLRVCCVVTRRWWTGCAKARRRSPTSSTTVSWPTSSDPSTIDPAPPGLLTYLLCQILIDFKMSLTGAAIDQSVFNRALSQRRTFLKSFTYTMSAKNQLAYASDSFSRFLSLYKFVCMHVCMHVWNKIMSLSRYILVQLAGRPPGPWPDPSGERLPLYRGWS